MKEDVTLALLLGGLAAQVVHAQGEGGDVGEGLEAQDVAAAERAAVLAVDGGQRPGGAARDVDGDDGGGADAPPQGKAGVGGGQQGLGFGGVVGEVEFPGQRRRPGQGVLHAHGLAQDLGGIRARDGGEVQQAAVLVQQSHGGRRRPR